MSKLRIFSFVILLSGVLPVYSQSGWKPAKHELVGPLYFLSSPLLEGREAGERGGKVAAEYIASMMTLYGLSPAGDNAEWFQNMIIKVEDKAVSYRNVLGMIRGTDTTKYVVIGAHYDHLGMRNDSIFTGASDNASGVSGMLALANRWSNRNERPPCNLIFAAWDGEEKGQVGSQYFVRHFTPSITSVLFYMNLDMIARSDPKDTLCNMLDVGFLAGRTAIKEIAERSNISSGARLVLDFWETEGDGESDYVHFAENKIPILTFFAGADEDYHTPGDTRDKIDWGKMIRVVALANGCLEEFLDRIMKPL